MTLKMAKKQQNMLYAKRIVQQVFITICIFIFIAPVAKN